jgi:hypothetical protein
MPEQMSYSGQLRHPHRCRRDREVARWSRAAASAGRRLVAGGTSPGSALLVNIITVAVCRPRFAAFGPDRLNASSPIPVRVAARGAVLAASRYLSSSGLSGRRAV